LAAQVGGAEVSPNDLPFDPLAAAAIAVLLVGLVLSARGCFMLWRARTAKPYLDRVALALPWLSERSLVRIGAALPAVVIGLGSLTASVVAGYLGASVPAESVLPGLSVAVVLAGQALFLMAMPMAVSTAILRRPRGLVPPPLRSVTRPSRGAAEDA
jgi:hypothetical protein